MTLTITQQTANRAVQLCDLSFLIIYNLFTFVLVLLLLLLGGVQQDLSGFEELAPPDPIALEPVKGMSFEQILERAMQHIKMLQVQIDSLQSQKLTRLGYQFNCCCWCWCNSEI